METSPGMLKKHFDRVIDALAARGRLQDGLKASEILTVSVEVLKSRGVSDPKVLEVVFRAAFQGLSNQIRVANDLENADERANMNGPAIFNEIARCNNEFNDLSDAIDSLLASASAPTPETVAKSRQLLQQMERLLPEMRSLVQAFDQVLPPPPPDALESVHAEADSWDALLDLRRQNIRFFAGDDSEASGPS